MKHFFALPALLRSTALLATASQHVFSVQDDLLAFPQYEVSFAKEWMSEEAVRASLSSNFDANAASAPSPPSQQLEEYQSQHDPTAQASARKDHEPVHYEPMILDEQPWLCRIPKVKRAEENTNVNDTLTRAEEEKELARATDRGWELLSGMQGNCVFFISGWWSYRFCYNQGIRQFHQLPPSRGGPVYPPVEDPSVPGYMLGTYEKPQEEDDLQKDAWGMSGSSKKERSVHGELIQRGESRYLVQKLGGGTICNLTGKERKIEVQFHCNPQSADRISLIKETSTCHYLMVLQTPRLCNDVAFLPPQKDQPNSISCFPVLREDEVEQYEHDLETLYAIEQEANSWEASGESAAATGGDGGAPIADHDVPVGDIFIGEHRLVPEGQTIEKSAIVGGGKETYVDTVASSDGKILGKEQLEKLGLSDPKALEELKKKLEKIAQGQSWKLDVIDTPRGREYRGIIGDEGEGDGKGEKKLESEKAEKTARQALNGKVAAERRPEVGSSVPKERGSIKEKKIGIITPGLEKEEGQAVKQEFGQEPKKKDGQPDQSEGAKEEDEATRQTGSEEDEATRQTGSEEDEATRQGQQTGNEEEYYRSEL